MEKTVLFGTGSGPCLLCTGVLPAEEVRPGLTCSSLCFPSGASTCQTKLPGHRGTELGAKADLGSVSDPRTTEPIFEARFPALC